MPKTFNRAPSIVNSPKMEYNFFNHNNWKGVNENKNFLAVDQETFENSKNIYVDEAGLLKSRPAIKLLSNNGFNDVLDMWKFGDTFVYLTYETMTQDDVKDLTNTRWYFKTSFSTGWINNNKINYDVEYDDGTVTLYKDYPQQSELGLYITSYVKNDTEYTHYCIKTFPGHSVTDGNGGIINDALYSREFPYLAGVVDFTNNNPVNVNSITVLNGKDVKSKAAISLLKDIALFDEEYSTGYYLTFVNDSRDDVKVKISSDNFKLILADEKIFAFFNDSLYYYDNSYSFTGNERWNEGSEYIYVPDAVIHTSGVSENASVKNTLTNSYNIIYRYALQDSLPIDMYGETLEVTVDGNKYQFIFDKSHQYSIVSKYTDLTEDCYNELLTGDKDIPCISISEKGNCILLKKNKILYSPEGKVFYELEDLIEEVNGSTYINDFTCLPTISRDGTTVFVHTQFSLYAYTLLFTSDSEKTFSNWTDVYLYYGLDFKILKYENERYNDYCKIDAITESTFTVSFLHSSNDYNTLVDDVYDSYDNVILANVDFENSTVPKQNDYDITNCFHDNTLLICEDGVFTKSNKSYGLKTLEGDGNVGELLNYDAKKFGHGLFPTVDFNNQVIYGDDVRGAEILPLNEINWEDISQSYFRGYKITINTDFFTVSYSTPRSTSLYDYIGGNIRSDLIVAPTEGGSTVPIAVVTYQLTDVENDLYCIQVRLLENFSEIIHKEIPLVSCDNSKKYVSSNTLYKTIDLRDVSLLSKEFKIYATVHNVLNDTLVKNDFKSIDITSQKSEPYSKLCNMSLCSKNSYQFAILQKDSLNRLYARLYTCYYSAGFTEWEFSEIFSPDCYKIVLDADGTESILTNKYIDILDTKSDLLFNSLPLYLYTSSKSIYLSNNNTLYSTNKDVLDFRKKVVGDNNYFVPDSYIEHYDFYFSKGKELYISKYPPEEDFKWYFPINQYESYDDVITNLHPISDNDVAVFFEDCIYYINKKDDVYTSNKSRINVGCTKGCEILTLLDNTGTIFSSPNGLVKLSYQDFIASTEQSLQYLSSPLSTSYKDFEGLPVKLYQHSNWLICYVSGNKKSFVYDIRNSSWWPMEYDGNLQKIITKDYKPLILSNKSLKVFDTSDFDYKDDIGKIDWRFTSQKLHLNAPNHTKHITNFTFSSVNDNDNPCTIDLTIRNYRKKMDQGKEEIIEYDINVIRTYVKRVNYSKVSEFQYTLKSDLDSAVQIPLCFSNIAIKYNITGAMR